MVNSLVAIWVKPIFAKYRKYRFYPYRNQAVNHLQGAFTFLHFGFFLTTCCEEFSWHFLNHSVAKFGVSDMHWRNVVGNVSDLKLCVFCVVFVF